MPPLTAEQREFRKGWVGASEIAGALGVSRWKRPIDVWLEKTGRQLEQPENPRADIGHRAEAVLLEWYCEDMGIAPARTIRGESRRHPQHHYAGCTPDFIVLTDDGKIDRLVQMKCVGARMATFWGDDDSIPGDVECQCQYEAEVCDAPRVDVVAWLGGTDFRIIPLERDREFGMMLMRGAEAFWRYVESDTPPPIDGSETWRQYLTRRFPQHEEEELAPAPEQAELWAIKALRAREAIKAAEADKDEADNHLRALIGTGAGVIGSDWYATWKTSRNGTRSLNVKWRKNANG